jgi:hypothetical protein
VRYKFADGIPLSSVTVIISAITDAIDHASPQVNWAWGATRASLLRLQLRACRLA